MAVAHTRVAGLTKLILEWEQQHVSSGVSSMCMCTWRTQRFSPCGENNSATCNIYVGIKAHLHPQQLHRTLVPSKHLLYAPCQIGGLVSAPGKYLIWFIHVHAAPALPWPSQGRQRHDFARAEEADEQKGQQEEWNWTI